MWLISKYCLHVHTKNILTENAAILLILNILCDRIFFLGFECDLPLKVHLRLELNGLSSIITRYLYIASNYACKWYLPLARRKVSLGIHDRSKTIHQIAFWHPY